MYGDVRLALLAKKQSEGAASGERGRGTEQKSRTQIRRFQLDKSIFYGWSSNCTDDPTDD